MILGLFPLKSANKTVCSNLVCFDLIFYIFFFLKYFGPYQTESDRISPYQSKSGPVSDQIGPYQTKSDIVRPRRKKNLPRTRMQPRPRESDSCAPAKSAHLCFLDTHSQK